MYVLWFFSIPVSYKLVWKCINSHKGILQFLLYMAGQGHLMAPKYKNITLFIQLKSCLLLSDKFKKIILKVVSN